MIFSPTAVLVVDDSQAIQEVLRAYLLKDFPGLMVVPAKTAADAIRLRIEVKPDVVIMDSDLEDCDGLQLIETFSTRPPRSRVLVYTGYVDAYTVYRVSQSDALGMVGKGQSLEILVEAVRSAAAGRRHFTPEVEAIRHQLDESKFVRYLSRRQQEMLGEFGCGLSDQKIAAKFGLSDSTVGNHRHDIMKKLNVHTTHDLMRYALVNGFTRQRRDTPGGLRAAGPIGSNPKAHR